MALALAAALLVGGASQVRAQEAAGRVEYVAGGTVFIGVVEASRWLPGDTVRLALRRGGDWLGRVRVLGVASTRLSAEWLAGAVTVNAGDSVRMELPRVRLDTTAVVPSPAAAAPQAGRGEGGGPTARTRGSAGVGGAQLTGRVGFELDAWRSNGGLGGQSGANTSLLPTLRLRAVLSQLPGDLRIRANLRGSYRSDDLGMLGPATQLFANELSIERAGRTLQLRAGRFANQYEPYSGYWDGGLVRVGREDGPGVGAAFGLDPRYGNQGFDTGRRKAAAFADLHHSGRQLRYDADVSVHRTWEGDSVALTSAGWTQQLGVGALRLTQLLRVDQGEDGWLVGLAQLTASVPVSAAARLRVRYSHDDPSAYFGLGTGQGWRTSRVGGALTWFGMHANAGVDVSGGWSRREGESRPGVRSISGWVDVPRVPLAGLGLELNASSWASGDQRTYSLGPSLRHVTGRGLVRLGYQLYHQELTWDTWDSHTFSLSLGQRLGRGDLDVRLQHETGGGLGGTRISSGFWLPL